MARRISSFFTLGSSNHGDDNRNASRPLSALHPSNPTERHSSSAQLVSHKSTPDLRMGVPSSMVNTEHRQATMRSSPMNSSRPSPHSSPALGPPLPGLEEDESLFLPPSHISRKPIPRQTGSPNGSRPQSRSATPRNRLPSRDRSAPNSRAASPAKLRPFTPTDEHSRRSWLPGSRGRPGPQNDETDGLHGNQSWLIIPQTEERLNYDLAPLINFQRTPELWNDACDTYIYLHSGECGRGPSFKIDSSYFTSSRKLAAAAYGRLSNGNNRRVSEDRQHRQLLEPTSNLRLNAPGSPAPSQRGSSNRSSSTDGLSNRDFPEDGTTQRQEISLHIPSSLQANLAHPIAQLSGEDIEAIVATRNVFAFLAGQPLVATSKHPSIFSILLKVADTLRHHEFTNLDGSTLGEEATVAFGHYVADFRLADVRSSREKTIEAIILGERMKYWPLYNEGFVHAIGKYESLVALHSPKYQLISETALKRMERAHLELFNRLLNVRSRLEDFDFASMWAGIAQSKTSKDSKGIRFKAWRSAFTDMRSHVLSLYKERYGSWPPKARSKKNKFEESGLNRLLLHDLYTDFSDLYDALVDRTSLTTRHMEIPTSDASQDADQMPTPRALRRVLSEYDRSTPPVLPPTPFDTPRLPSLTTIRGQPDTQDPKALKREAGRKLKSSEINLALLRSYNHEHGQDPVKSTPFIDAFIAFERRCARGKSIEEIIDIRLGQWIFLYAVLQALPLVVVDAPDLKFTQGVEYFLCQVPKGNPPWMQDNYQQKQSWYGVNGGLGLVSLPADVVEHGVDGIYRRSHCWILGEKWARPSGLLDEGDTSYVQDMSDYMRSDSDRYQGFDVRQLESPRIPFAGELLLPVLPGSPGSRPGSRGSSASPSRGRRGSLAMGLEQLPLPVGISPSGSRPTSTFNPDMSFDKILAAGAGSPLAQDKKTKKK